MNDQLDLLAEFMGVGEKVAAITNSVRGDGNKRYRMEGALGWVRRWRRTPSRGMPVANAAARGLLSCGSAACQCRHITHPSTHLLPTGHGWIDVAGGGAGAATGGMWGLGVWVGAGAAAGGGKL